jgi:hypothetical protein
MTDDQINAFAERLVVAFETIASALEGLNENYGRHLGVLHPEPRQYREAVVTRVPSEEDRIREAQGADGSASVDDWLSDIEREEEEQDFGVREREWLQGHARAPRPEE